VRLNTANGFGSTNTLIRRFTNTVDNLGTAITYTDSATLGSSFTVNEDGEYQISYSDTFTSASSFGISKNSSQLTTAIGNISVADRLAVADTGGVNYVSTVSWSGYLLKNDIVRPHTQGSTTGATPALAQFTISKVGKPNLTSVDVTPFVNTKTQDVESISYNAASNTLLDLAGEVRFPTSVSTTNKGIISIVDDSANTRTKFVALKDCTVSFNFNALLTVATDVLVLYKNGVSLGYISSAAYANGAYVSGSWVGQLKANDYLTVGPTVSIVSSTTPVLLAITATADNNATASPTQQVSSDTMSFAFKATAIDPSVDPIGTFNTFVYTINTTNTFTISATAPTQTASSMNVNGIQVFSRVYAAASTTGNPARVDIFIGKGLKSKQVDAYAAAGKTLVASYDKFLAGTTLQYGTLVIYNEVTGILTIDAGEVYTTTITGRGSSVNATDGSGVSGTYFVFNASKSPSLVTLPIPATPTVQKFTSGSGTYIPSSSLIKYIRVRMVGGGGGGAGNSNNGANNIYPGLNGGNTTFSDMIAYGGVGGNGAVQPGNSGASATLGTSAVGSIFPGGAGNTSSGYNASGTSVGGNGGSSIFGGSGPGGAGGNGGAAISNTGSGGGGAGGVQFSAYNYGAGGGAAGGGLDAIIKLVKNFSYAIGAGGAGTGGNNYTGGAGGSGYIEVIEYYI
jgi:hypothetical protein